MGVNSTILNPSKVKKIKVKIIRVNCRAVLYLDIFVVTNSKPLFEIIQRKPVMNESLKIITPTIQKSIIPIKAKEINADKTSILSASGSKNLPSGVI